MLAHHLSFSLLLIFHWAEMESALSGNVNLTRVTLTGVNVTVTPPYETLPLLDKVYNVSSDPIVNPYNFKIIIDAGKCSPKDQLLIIIHSSTKAEYCGRRSLMRSTWLSSPYLKGHVPYKLKILFFVGLANNVQDQKRILYESEMYRDIVQSNFIDSYYNNTYKAMSYLRWTSINCPKAKLLLKLDDDVLVRMKTLDILVKNISHWMKSGSRLYVGKRNRVSDPVRVVDDKWYMPREVWPYGSYPLWLQGMVYFLSPGYTAELFQAALRTKYMFTDDVFIGICVNKTALPGQETIVVGNFSSCHVNLTQKITGKETARLRKDWQQTNISFFHLPDKQLYWNFFYSEL